MAIRMGTAVRTGKVDDVVPTDDPLIRDERLGRLVKRLYLEAVDDAALLPREAQDAHVRITVEVVKEV